MSPDRDVAIVLSGGGMNGLLLELGFLQRLRESPLWPRVGWIYGTSAGALTGTMAALDRLDDLEEFCRRLRPEETFRPHRLWQLPFTGLHDYALPETIAERLEPTERMAEGLRASPIELVVCVTDVGATHEESGGHAFERTYSSRTVPPREMAQAVLASAAISALVLPLRVGEMIGTDGGWVRNFPLGHAYDNPRVQAIAGFRYLSRYPTGSTESLVRFRRRLERFRAVPPVRALIGEIQAAEERQERGEPPHLADMIVRLMRIAVSRNTTLEERYAAERDDSVRELEQLRRETIAIATRNALPGRRRRVREELERRFAAARFPFRHDRVLPTMLVRAEAGPLALEPSFKPGLEWPDEIKDALVARGRALADVALASADGAAVLGSAAFTGRGELGAA
jgi:predicted acylesterase/phospholipase RssA